MQNKLSVERHLAMLQIALGEACVKFLNQDDVIEVMANPDGSVWLDTLSQGKYKTELIFSAIERLNIIKLIASLNQLSVTEYNPELACEIAFAEARFQAWIPPISEFPTFTIRKKARQILSIDDYVANAWVNLKEAAYLKKAVQQRWNILIAGGTGSGKTTFANALLHELKDSPDRIIVLEDLPELQISAKDVVSLRTSEEVSMRDLVKGSLRMRPDRIIIGEVRDGAALDMLKAWNTGHPGGICTLHANSAESVLTRLADLISEAIPQVPHHLIDEAVDLILFMKKSGSRDYYLSEIKPLSEKARLV